MADIHPGNAERLHEYWVHGEGAAKIRWGEPDDFARCTRQLIEHAQFTPEQAHGYCNLAHKAALGFYPATHAAMEKKVRRSAVADTKAQDYDADGLDSSWDGDHSDLPDLHGLQMHHFEQAAADMGMSAPGGDVSRAMPKLGTGARFKKLKSSLAAKGAHDPGALAAYIGRKKFGRAKFTKLAAKARGAHGGGGVSRTLTRPWPLTDIRIVSRAGGDGSGRVGGPRACGRAAELPGRESPPRPCRG